MVHKYTLMKRNLPVPLDIRAVTSEENYDKHLKTPITRLREMSDIERQNMRNEDKTNIPD